MNNIKMCYAMFIVWRFQIQQIATLMILKEFVKFASCSDALTAWRQAPGRKRVDLTYCMFVLGVHSGAKGVWLRYNSLVKN